MSGLHKLRFALGCLVAGGALCFWGFNELKLSRQSSVTPQSMSCLELVMYGEGDNAHVALDGFWYDLENAIAEHPENNEDHFYKVYIPLHPINGEAGTVLLRSDDLPDVGSIQRQATQSEVRGMVINSISKLGREEQELLQAAMRPGEEPVILDLDRQPKAAGTAIGILFGGGCVMLLPFAGALLSGHRLKHEAGDEWADGPADFPAAGWGAAAPSPDATGEGRPRF